MSRRGWLSASILYLSFLGNCWAADTAKPDGPHWISNWEEGRKAARTSGKPLFVVFRCQH